MYSPNFSVENKIFVLSLLYNGDNSYLFVNGKNDTQFKAKNSEIKAYQLALGAISAFPNLSNGNIKNNKLYGNVYNFSVDYSAITNELNTGHSRFFDEKSSTFLLINLIIHYYTISNSINKIMHN